MALFDSRGESAPASPGRVVASLFLAVLLALGSAGAALGQSDPSGNNGTVKIHDGGLEPSPEIRNQPHVCTFHLHSFFADAAQAGTWWIESWPPTGDRTVVLSGAYLTDTSGEFRTPPEPGVYDLPDGHYKLFWEGRSTTNVKHKVFWVDCAGEQARAGGGGQGNVQVTVGASAAASIRASIRAQEQQLAALATLSASIRAEVSAETSALAGATTEVRAPINA